MKAVYSPVGNPRKRGELKDVKLGEDITARLRELAARCGLPAPRGRVIAPRSEPDQEIALRVRTQGKGENAAIRYQPDDGPRASVQ